MQAFGADACAALAAAGLDLAARVEALPVDAPTGLTPVKAASVGAVVEVPPAGAAARLASRPRAELLHELRAAKRHAEEPAGVARGGETDENAGSDENAGPKRKRHTGKGRRAAGGDAAEEVSTVLANTSNILAGQ